MVKKCARYNIGIRRIATDDGSILLQLLFTIAVISAGIFLQINVLQWTAVALLSSFFLFTGFYRSAIHLVAIYDDSITRDQAIRIKAMSNLVVTFTAGITIFSFLMIFMPKINQLL
jgi:diacylglycerol kinase